MEGYILVNVKMYPKVVSQKYYEENAVFFDENHVLLPEKFVIGNSVIAQRIENLLSLVTENKKPETRTLLDEYFEELKQIKLKYQQRVDDYAKEKEQLEKEGKEIVAD